MWKSLITVAIFGLSNPVLADPSNEDADALRQEIRQARQELREAGRRLERLTEQEMPNLRMAPKFNFSTSGKRPMVGIIMAQSGSRSGGVLLSGVTPDAPAEKAGLKSGDLLTQINGHDLSGRDGLDLANQLLADLEVGDRFEFTYQRASQTHTTTVEVEEHEPTLAFSFSGSGDWFDFDRRPFSFGFSTDGDSFNIDPEGFREMADRYRGMAFDTRKLARLKGLKNLPYVWSMGWAWAGLEMKQLDTGLGRYFGTDRGALVLAAQNLDDSDLQGGDVILSIEGEQTDNPKQVMRLLRRFGAGDQITAQIMRDGKQREVILLAPEAQDGSYSYSWSFGDDDDEQDD